MSVSLCPSTSDGQTHCIQNLSEVVTKCLTKASKKGCVSIVFPALGTGNLNYPAHETARIMLETIDTFQQSNPSTSLRDVRIVVFAEAVAQVVRMC